MPCDMKRYPPEWKDISRRIRESAGYRCEWCGKPQGEAMVTAEGHWYDAERDVWRSGANPRDQKNPVGDGGKELPGLNPRDWKLTQNVITVAHTSLCVGGSKHDKHDLTGLKALCNRCHLLHDLEDHMANAKATRQRKKREAEEAAGVMALPMGVEGAG